jgi:hypothetical protein
VSEGTGLGQLASAAAPVGIITSEVERNSFHTLTTEFRASADNSYGMVRTMAIRVVLSNDDD